MVIARVQMPNRHCARVGILAGTVETQSEDQLRELCAGVSDLAWKSALEGVVISR